MKQPQDSPANLAGPTKTMFYTEGNSAASLVTNRGGNRSERVMTFPTAEAAVGWCRINRAILVYLPFDQNRN